MHRIWNKTIRELDEPAQKRLASIHVWLLNNGWRTWSENHNELKDPTDWEFIHCRKYGSDYFGGPYHIVEYSLREMKGGRHHSVNVKIKNGHVTWKHSHTEEGMYGKVLFPKWGSTVQQLNDYFIGRQPTVFW